MSHMALEPMKPRPAKQYNCGRHGRLTVRQIAYRTGLGEAQVRQRISAGTRGDDLLVPHVPRNRRQQFTTRCAEAAGTYVIAFLLARDFSGRTPGVDQLQRRFECSRATAYRIRRAWRDVFGEPAAQR